MIPELVDVGAFRKVLPVGRYSCLLAEVQERYVPKDDENRVAIWNAFLDTISLIKETIGSLAEVWIGGSFITSEEYPHDIDVVFFFKEELLDDLEAEGAFVLNVLSRRMRNVRRVHELVDGYALVVPPTEIDNVATRNYAAARGYWDQFWSKARFDDEDTRWLYPVAGYLEVMIDGYDA